MARFRNRSATCCALLLAAGIAGTSRPSRAAEEREGPACRTAVSLTGDRSEARLLSRALARFEIVEEKRGSCRHLTVAVRRIGPQLAVQIADRTGVSVVRTVSSIDVAAAVVDSWVHRGFDTRQLQGMHRHDGLEHSDVEPRPPRRRRATPPSAVMTAAVEPIVAVQATPGVVTDPAHALAAMPTPAPETIPVLERTYPAATSSTASHPDRLTMTLGADAVKASDGSQWWGGHGSACARVGRFCAGALAQGAAGAAIVGDPGTTRRTTADLLALVDLPIALGRMSLVPGVGVGAGLLRAITADPPPTNPKEMTGARNATSWAFRTTTHLVLAIPLGGRFAIDLGGALDMSLPRRAPASDGQGGLYPAEPLFFFRGGVALRYGIP